MYEYVDVIELTPKAIELLKVIGSKRDKKLLKRGGRFKPEDMMRMLFTLNNHLNEEKINVEGKYENV